MTDGGPNRSMAAARIDVGVWLNRVAMGISELIDSRCNTARRKNACIHRTCCVKDSRETMRIQAAPRSRNGICTHCPLEFGSGVRRHPMDPKLLWGIISIAALVVAVGLWFAMDIRRRRRLRQRFGPEY